MTNDTIPTLQELNAIASEASFPHSFLLLRFANGLLNHTSAREMKLLRDAKYVDTSNNATVYGKLVIGELKRRVAK